MPLIWWKWRSRRSNKNIVTPNLQASLKGNGWRTVLLMMRSQFHRNIVEGLEIYSSCLKALTYYWVEASFQLPWPPGEALHDQFHPYSQKEVAGLFMGLKFFTSQTFTFSWVHAGHLVSELPKFWHSVLVVRHVIHYMAMRQKGYTMMLALIANYWKHFVMVILAKSGQTSSQI